MKTGKYLKRQSEELNTNSLTIKLMKLLKRMDLGSSWIGSNKENFLLLKWFSTIIDLTLNYLIYGVLYIVPSTLFNIDK